MANQFIANAVKKEIKKMIKEGFEKLCFSATGLHTLAEGKLGEAAGARNYIFALAEKQAAAKRKGNDTLKAFNEELQRQLDNDETNVNNLKNFEKVSKALDEAFKQQQDAEKARQKELATRKQYEEELEKQRKQREEAERKQRTKELEMRMQQLEKQMQQREALEREQRGKKELAEETEHKHKEAAEAEAKKNAQEEEKKKKEEQQQFEDEQRAAIERGKKEAEEAAKAKDAEKKEQLKRAQQAQRNKQLQEQQQSLRARAAQQAQRAWALAKKYPGRATAIGLGGAAALGGIATGIAAAAGAFDRSGSNNQPPQPKPFDPNDPDYAGGKDK
jgi:hypothetical protein